jgi:hypothetical protein
MLKIVAAVGTLLATLSVAFAAEALPAKLTYAIIMDGKPIGSETYDISRDGDRTDVQLTTDTHGRVMFVNFHYHHQRSESWIGGKLQHLVADTDDDGSKHHVEAVQTADGALTVTADGKPLAVPANVFPLTMWNRAITAQTALFAVENADSPYRVKIKDVGAETLTVGGQKLATEHYAMSGDVERDFWYDSEGLLAKVAFRRQGFGIAIVRTAVGG